MAKQHVPSFIDIGVEEHEDFLTLELKLKSDISLKRAIHKIEYPDDAKNEEEILNRIKTETEKEVLETIRDFGVTRIEELKDAFSLEDFYSEKYRDKNIICKVEKA